MPRETIPSQRQTRRSSSSVHLALRSSSHASSAICCLRQAWQVSKPLAASTQFKWQIVQRASGAEGANKRLRGRWPNDLGADLTGEAADEIERLRKTIGNLERSLRRWLDMQSWQNSAMLYAAGLEHFGIKPVIPD